MGEIRNMHKILAETPDRKESLYVNGRVVLIWFLKKQWVNVDWIHLPQNIYSSSVLVVHGEKYVVFRRRWGI
jgi:hypothetical protein